MTAAAFAEKSLLAHTGAMKRWQEEVSAHRIAACAAEEEELSERAARRLALLDKSHC